MTRARSTQPGDVPNALNAAYYAQRASAALIVTEAAQISPQGKGYSFTPGIYSDEQVRGWRLVTDAVHAKGGRIFLQLWHVGRMSHPDFHNGALPVAPSAVPFEAQIWKVDPATGVGAMVDCPTPRALALDEIAAIVDDYRRGAKNAIAAGFDGVEIHGANGYLIDQFLRTGTNTRTDLYGGPPANRARFLLEVVAAVREAWGGGRVGVRLSPLSAYNDMRDDDPLTTFSHAAAALGELGLAYLHVVEARPVAAGQPYLTPALRRAFRGPLVINGGLDRDSAEAALRNEEGDAASFAVKFLANPDLPARFAAGAPLNLLDRATMYGGGAKGYVDYPFLEASPVGAGAAAAF